MLPSGWDGLRSLSFSFYLFQNLNEEWLCFWNVSLDGFPHRFKIYRKVIMDQNISHPSDVTPGDIREFHSKIHRYVFYGLSNDFNRSQHCEDCFLIFDKIFVGHVSNKMFC